MSSDEVFALRQKCKIDAATTPIFDSERPKTGERLTDIYLYNSQCSLAAAARSHAIGV